MTVGLCRIADLEVLRVASASLSTVVTFEDFVDLLARLAGQVAGQNVNPSGASLAVPFPFDCEAGVSLMKHKLKPLYGRNLRSALALRFGWAPDRLRFLNDASAFLLGELATGNVKGAARAAGLTLGTGIGSAFAIGGRCVTSGDGVPPEGEIWNLPFGESTVEDLVSTRAIRSAYLARAGRDPEVAAVAAAAPQDADARKVFADFGAHLGLVLRKIVGPFHPEKVVIGGGIAHAADLFLPETEKQIARLGFHAVVSALFDRAPLVGAASYWREEIEKREHEPSPAASARI